MELKKLPKTKNKNGFVYNLVKRSDTVAAYSQKLKGDSKISGFEVFKVKKCAGANFGGISLPPYEAFPTNEKFGKSAWSFASFDEAMKCYDRLNNNDWYREVYKPKETFGNYSICSSKCYKRDRYTCQSCRKKIQSVSIVCSSYSIKKK